MGLAVLAIALFLAIYTLLGNQPAFTRLMTALFVPPLVLAVIVGGYFLVRRR
jgi:ABC-type molybdate transport system permease subunit